MSITEESCTSEGCSVRKHDLPEIAARSWFAVVSREEETLGAESNRFNSAEAAKVFARVFSSGCGTHKVGFRTEDDKAKCLGCHQDDILDSTDNDDSNNGELVIAEDMDINECDVLGEEQQDLPDQAALVEGSSAIWRGKTFAKTKYITFFDLVELALKEGLNPKFVGSHMSSWNIRDACWIFLLNKERSANNNKGDTFASKLPAFCSELPGDTISARFAYLTEASQKLPEGKTESERNAITLLQKAPAPVKKRAIQPQVIVPSYPKSPCLSQVTKSRRAKSRLMSIVLAASDVAHA